MRTFVNPITLRAFLYAASALLVGRIFPDGKVRGITSQVVGDQEQMLLCSSIGMYRWGDFVFISLTGLPDQSYRVWEWQDFDLWKHLPHFRESPLICLPAPEEATSYYKLELEEGGEPLKLWALADFWPADRNENGVEECFDTLAVTANGTNLALEADQEGDAWMSDWLSRIVNPIRTASKMEAYAAHSLNKVWEMCVAGIIFTSSWEES